MSEAQNLRRTFEAFMSEESVIADAAIDSTKASYSGGCYYVEILEDSWRLLWSGQIGNLYYSPGILMSIPVLSKDEWDEDEDPEIIFLDNVIDELHAHFEHMMTKEE